jgi:hypothetical protein
LQDEIRVARSLIGGRESDLLAVRSENDKVRSHTWNANFSLARYIIVGKITSCMGLSFVYGVCQGFAKCFSVVILIKLIKCVLL